MGVVRVVGIEELHTTTTYCTVQGTGEGMSYCIPMSVSETYRCVQRSCLYFAPKTRSREYASHPLGHTLKVGLLGRPMVTTLVMVILS